MAQARQATRAARCHAIVAWQYAMQRVTRQRGRTAQSAVEEAEERRRAAEASRTSTVSCERRTVEADAADGLDGRQVVDVAASTYNHGSVRERMLCVT